MPPSRRAVLATGVAMTGLAGCLGLGGGDDDPGGPAEDTGTGEPPEGALQLSFGEGAVFTDDQGIELAVTMSDPRLRETVPVVRDGQIYVDSPEETAYFLFATVRLENEGSEPIDPPRGLYFEADGDAVDRAAIRTPGRKYRDVGELAPGESAAATVAFPAPAGADTGTVELRFTALLESPPARWTFEYDDVPTQSADLDREGLGDTLTVGAGDYEYAFTPTGARLVDAYSYGDGQEHAAPDGSRFLLLSVRSEVVGEEPVKLPTPYQVRLAADGSVVRPGTFERDGEGYPGRVDPTPPGESLSGVLLYEVPAAASQFVVRLAVGNQTVATWPVQPATPTPGE